jgi:hypothetical protein
MPPHTRTEKRLRMSVDSSLASATASTSTRPRRSTASDMDGEASDSNEVVRVRARTELGLSPFLESSQLPSAVRSAVETGKEKDMMVALAAFREERSKEIREVCDRNYQEFVRSVDELLDVRADTMTLKDDIVELNKSLQQNGKKITTLTEQLVAHKRQLRNLKLLSTLLGSCKQFWLLVDRANKDTREGHFYEALRSIVDLERALQSPSPLREVEFGRYVLGALPLMRERVREGAIYHLNQWLELVRRRAVEIGKTAVDRTSRRAEHERRRLRINLNAHTSRHAKSNGTGRSGHNGASKKVADDADASMPIEPPLFTALDLSFFPLYQASGVASAVGG